MISFVIRLKSRAHFVFDRGLHARGETFIGTNVRRRKQARLRVAITIAIFSAAYLVIGGRLLQYGLSEPVVSASIGGNVNPPFNPADPSRRADRTVRRPSQTR